MTQHYPSELRATRAVRAESRRRTLRDPSVAHLPSLRLATAYERRLREGDIGAR